MLLLLLPLFLLLLTPVLLLLLPHNTSMDIGDHLLLFIVSPGHNYAYEYWNFILLYGR